MNLILVEGPKLRSVFVLVVEVGLISVWGIELDQIFSVGIGVVLFLCGGRKWLGFSMWIEINFILVSRHQNYLAFRVGIETDLISGLGQMNLIFVGSVELYPILRFNRFPTCVQAHWFRFHRIFIRLYHVFSETDIIRYVRVQFLVGYRPVFFVPVPRDYDVHCLSFSGLRRLALPSGPTALTQGEHFRRYVIVITLLQSHVQ